jgi:hypothetical protein
VISKPSLAIESAEGLGWFESTGPIPMPVVHWRIFAMAVAITKKPSQWMHCKPNQKVIGEQYPEMLGAVSSIG